MWSFYVLSIYNIITDMTLMFLDPEGGSQKAALVVLLVVGVSSLRVQKSLRLS